MADFTFPHGPPQPTEHPETLALPPSLTPSVTDPPFDSSAVTLAAPVQGAAPPLGEQVPGYEILGELGRGGMGVVYKARHRQLNRIVALKMILAGAHAGQDDRQRFLLEAEAVARLQHPNIVQIHEVGEVNGLPYFALEFCGGGSLSDRFNGTPLPAGAVAELVETLARAMHAAHEQRVVHRDLKPANVLLANTTVQPSASTSSFLRHAGKVEPRPFAGWVPKVTDFGLAKKLDDDSHTQSGSVLGTPSYMSPEQAAGQTRTIGPATDVYALGALLYEGLTGRPPFKAATPMDTVYQVIHGEPVAPSQLAASVPRDLETICLKCLQKEPHKRYASAEELAEDLRRFQAGEPILARPVGRLERSWRWCRRNPTTAGLMTAVAVSLLAGTFVASLLAYRARVEAEQANRARQTARDERTAADEARAAAQKAAEDSRRRLVRLNATTGTRAVESGDLRAGLLWYAEAWRLDRDPEQEPSHRLRLGGVLARMPRLEGACFHTAPVLDARFDAEGKRVLTRTNESRAYLWDPARSDRVAPPLEHGGRVLHAAFAPNGRLVVTCSADKTARLWEVGTGRPRLAPLEHPAAVLHAALSPDGLLLATACADDKVRLWQVETGKLRGDPMAVGGKVSFVAFSPDGKRLLTASENDRARVWSVAEGKPLTPPVAHIRREMRWLGDSLGCEVEPAFLPDSDRFVTYAQGACVWNAGGKLLKKTGTMLRQGKHLCVSRDGRRILAMAGTLGKLWDPATGKTTHLVHPREAWAGCFSPDGKRVATASSSGKVHVWDAATGRELIQPLQHVGEIARLQFAPDGRRLLAAGTDGTARVWRVDPNPVRARAFSRLDGNADRRGYVRRPGGQRACYRPDGRAELRFGGTGPVRLFATTPLKPGPVLPVTGVLHARFSPDGRRVLTATATVARVWDAATGKPVGPPLPLTERVREVRFDAAGRRLLLAQENLTLQVREVETGRALLGPLRQILVEDAQAGPALLAPVGRLHAVALSPDGRRAVASGGGYGLVRVYEVDTGKSFDAPVHEGLVPGLDFSPDSRLILSGSSDTTARLWEAATGKPAGPPLQHPKFVRHAAFSPDGRRIATFDGNGDVRVWDATTGDLLLPPQSHPAGRRWYGRVWFSSDGRRVVGQVTNQTWQAVEWPLPHFRVPAEQMPALVHLLSGRALDATGGLVMLRDRDFRRQASSYRAAFLAWKLAQD